uniref:Uncharacterized protein n=1 Tax=Cacopsylla melanoneura TaxID=428564 RepID=A0A8D8ZAR0_9HEMI
MSISKMNQLFDMDRQTTPLEPDLRNDTILRLIMDQVSMTREMRKSLDKLDRKVEHLSLERFDTSESMKLLELFLSTLNEELLVLHQLQHTENDIQDQIDDIVDDIQLKQDKVNIYLHSGT